MYPGCRHASSRSPLSQEELSQIQTLPLQAEPRLQRHVRSSAYRPSQCAHVHAVHSESASDVSPQAPAPTAVRRSGSSFLEPRRFLRHIRKSESLPLPLSLHLPQQFQRLPQRQVLRKYARFYLHFYSHRSAAPDLRWNRYHGAAAERSGSHPALNDGSWQSTDIPFRQADVRLLPVSRPAPS